MKCVSASVSDGTSLPSAAADADANSHLCLLYSSMCVAMNDGVSAVLGISTQYQAGALLKWDLVLFVG